MCHPSIVFAYQKTIHGQRGLWWVAHEICIETPQASTWACWKSQHDNRMCFGFFWVFHSSRIDVAHQKTPRSGIHRFRIPRDHSWPQQMLVNFPWKLYWNPTSKKAWACLRSLNNYRTCFGFSWIFMRFSYHSHGFRMPNDAPMCHPWPRREF